MLLDEGTQVIPEDSKAVDKTLCAEAGPDDGVDSLPDPAHPEVEDKYAIGEVVAVGGMGAVYRAQDPRIRRTVAIKVLHPDTRHPEEARRRFIAEARIIGQLEHPGIPPVHDLGIGADGNPFYTMRLLNGLTLADIVAHLRQGHRRLTGDYPLERLLTVFQKVCDTVAFAHDKGVVHRDLKPHNIVVGNYGEVWVVDWGLAKRVDSSPAPATGVVNLPAAKDFAVAVAQESKDARIGTDPDRTFLTRAGEVLGTPGFMAPEQAFGMGGTADPRSDIYALGCILYTLLTTTPPIEYNGLDDFLPKLKDGKIQSPLTFNAKTGRRRRDRAAADGQTGPCLDHCPGGRVPPSLAAIAMRALASDPRDRYQSVRAMQRDIEAYQYGLIPSAERAGWAKRARNYLWRHRRALAMTSVIGAAIVGLGVLGAILFLEKMKEWAHWGRPVHSLRFDNDSWRKDWVVREGRFEVTNDWLVTSSSSSGAYIAMYNHKLPDRVMIEFEGMILTNSTPGDLSVIWSPDAGLTSCYRMQVGAWQNTFARITHGYQLEYTPFRLNVGEVYRIQASIDGQTLVLRVNGQVICEHRSLFPIGAGYIGLYGFFSGHAFRHVRIYRRAVAEKLAATAIGDSYYDRKMYALACEEYARVMESHADKPLGEEACYKQGLCLYQLGEYDRALAVWNALKSQPLRDIVMIHQADRLFAQQRDDDAINLLRALATRDAERSRHQAGEAWSGYAMARIKARAGTNILAGYLAAGQDWFASDVTRHETLAALMLCLGRTNELARQFPDNQMRARAEQLLLSAGLNPKR